MRGHFVYILFQYMARSAQLQLEEKSDTTPLHVRVLTVCATVCVRLCGWYMCMPTMSAEAFVVCSASYGKAHVYSLHSSPPTSTLFTERNVVLILIIF